MDARLGPRGVGFHRGQGDESQMLSRCKGRAGVVVVTLLNQGTVRRGEALLLSAPQPVLSLSGLRGYASRCRLGPTVRH